jgi:hypothetical protein
MSGARAVIPEELLDFEGRLFTKVKRPGWRRPDRVELVGDSELHIWFSGYPGLDDLGFIVEANENTPVVRPPADLLERFLELSTASAPQIRKFAQRYGQLGIFQQAGRPNVSALSDEEEPPDCWCEIELCEVWRSFATAMAALLRIAKSVYSNSPGDQKDWDCLRPDFPQDMRERYFDSTMKRIRGEDQFSAEESLSPEESWLLITGLCTKVLGERHRTARYARLRLTMQMDKLMAMAKIRPYFAWTSRSDRPQVLYAGSSLLSYLVLQLSNRMAKIDGHAFCDHCGKHYEPDRAPRSDRRNFCRDCHDAGIPVQLAVRKYRQKQRGRKRRAAH